MMDRRSLLKHLAVSAGGVVLVPAISRCGGASASASGSFSTRSAAKIESTTKLSVPKLRPADWDPIDFNRRRGNQGAIPESYLDDVNGATGAAKHLGKHLPYLPDFPAEQVPAGFVALMWGDPSKGHAAHPNAARSAANNYEGHWYNWIRTRVASEASTEEAESRFSGWPQTEPDDQGAYAVAAGDAIEADGGRNTVYLVALPSNATPGSTLRIWAHCLTHGEYVDFLTLPAA